MRTNQQRPMALAVATLLHNAARDGYITSVLDEAAELCKIEGHGTAGATQMQAYLVADHLINASESIAHARPWEPPVSTPLVERALHEGITHRLRTTADTAQIRGRALGGQTIEASLYLGTAHRLEGLAAELTGLQHCPHDAKYRDLLFEASRLYDAVVNALDGKETLEAYSERLTEEKHNAMTTEATGL